MSRTELERPRFFLVHVGINCADEEEAKRTADTFCRLFGWKYKAGNTSDFAGREIECMKAPFLGQKGHIAIGTSDVDYAIEYFEANGIDFMENTRKTDTGGKTKAIYFREEVGGFAVHLIKSEQEK